MKQVKQWMKKTIVICLMLVTGFVFSIQPVCAGSDYWYDTYHLGKHYFKYNEKTGRVYISKKKNSGFRKTAIDSWQYVSNGKQVMYVSKSGGRYYIKSYDIASEKVKKIKKLPKGGFAHVSAVEGGYLWMSDWNNDLYRFEIKTGKLKKMKKNIGSVVEIRSPYYLFTIGDSKVTKVHPGESMLLIPTSKLEIYKIRKNGKLKRIKSLGTAYSPYIDKNKEKKPAKVYYARSNSHKLYQINENGKKKKLIFSTKGYIGEIYDTHCIFFIDNGAYKYNYKSKTIRKTDY